MRAVASRRGRLPPRRRRCRRRRSGCAQPGTFETCLRSEQISTRLPSPLSSGCSGRCPRPARVRRRSGARPPPRTDLGGDPASPFR